jgi:hypothetical protein
MSDLKFFKIGELTIDSKVIYLFKKDFINSYKEQDYKQNNYDYEYESDDESDSKQVKSDDTKSGDLNKTEVKQENEEELSLDSDHSENESLVRIRLINKKKEYYYEFIVLKDILQFSGYFNTALSFHKQDIDEKGNIVLDIETDVININSMILCLRHLTDKYISLITNLQFRKDKIIPKRIFHLNEIYFDWEVGFIEKIDSMNRKYLSNLIVTANYLDNDDLLQLCASKHALIIREIINDIPVNLDDPDFNDLFNDRLNQEFEIENQNELTNNIIDFFSM